MITHRERLEACIKGQNVDRPPVALWRHFPVDDQSPVRLAEATINYQRTYDWDLIKVTPASSFCLRDWGIADEWQGDSEGTRRYTRRVIDHADDWERIPILDPTSSLLGAQIECLKILRREFDSPTPLIQTIFSPLAQAKNLAGGERLIAHIRQNPQAVMKGLQNISETTRQFVDACVNTGIDGIFYAVQHAQATLLNLAEFMTFGKLLDIHSMNPAKNLPFNILHAHGSNIYFDALIDYPVSIINWHDRETPPTLAEAQTKFRGAVCGGLQRETVVYNDPANVINEARDAITQTRGARFILGTGCVVPIIAPHGNLMAVRKVVEEA